MESERLSSNPPTSPQLSLTNKCPLTDTACFEKPVQADWSIVVVKPLSVVIPGMLANFSCVSGYWVVGLDVEVCKDRRTVIKVNVIP
jgi:hypothetical protein